MIIVVGGGWRRWTLCCVLNIVITEISIAGVEYWADPRHEIVSQQPHDHYISLLPYVICKREAGQVNTPLRYLICLCMKNRNNFFTQIDKFFLHSRNPLRCEMEIIKFLNNDFITANSDNSLIIP